MFKDYLNSFQPSNLDPKQLSSFDDQKWDSSWDVYWDKQLKHLVVEYEFDFRKISEILNGLNINIPINETICRHRWLYLHLKRKIKEKESLKPIISHQIISINYENLFKNEQKPSDYNILKDSIRGNPSEFKQKEQEFLSNLESIGLDDEEFKIEKPLLFKAQFVDQKTFTLTKEILSKEKAEEILAKKIDFSRINQASDDNNLANQSILINNFVQSEPENIVIQKEPAKTEIKDGNSNENLRKIEQGILSIDDVENELNIINKDFSKKNDIIDENKPDLQLNNEKDLLILEEINNFKKKEIEKPKSSSSSDSETDFLEYQRSLIKTGNTNIFKKKKKNKDSLKKETNNFSLKELILKDKKIEKNKKNLEENKEDFSASEKFRNQLKLEEIERKKKEEREKDLEQMKILEEKFKNDVEAIKKRKKAEKLKKLEEDALKLESQKKIFELQKKELELEYQRKILENQIKSDLEKQHQIFYEKKQKVQNKILNFVTRSYLSCFYDENIAILSQISSLPSKILSEISDSKAYQLSRFGITKRYQILVFPYYEIKGYAPEILNFFMRNSVFCTDSSKKPFPFTLISFVIGASAKNIIDNKDSSIIFSNYLKDNLLVNQLIELENYKKFIFLFFDTYAGDSQLILEDYLEIPLVKEVLTDKTIEKIRKNKQIQLKNNANLKDLLIIHQKNMNTTLKIFHNVSTFHALCLKNSISSVNQIEIGILFQKKYFSNEINDKNLFLKIFETAKKNSLDLISLKSVYFDSISYQEFIKIFENLKFLDLNSGFIVYCFSGTNINQKLEKIIGSSDLFIAKKLQKKSLNALYVSDINDCFHYITNKNISKRLLAYFFGGRHQELDQITVNKALELEKVEKYSVFQEENEYNPIFQVITQCVEQYNIIIPAFNRNFIGKILNLIQNFDFILKEIKTIGKQNLQMIKHEKLNKFMNDFLYLDDNLAIFICVEGIFINSLKKAIVKILNLKKKSIFISKNTVDFNVISNLFTHQNLTKCLHVPYFLVFWPYHETLTHYGIFNGQFDLLLESNFELLSFNYQTKINKNEQIKQLFVEILKENCLVPNYMKKKNEFYNLLELLAEFLMESKGFLAVFRFQEANDDHKTNKLLDHLSKSELFKNSIQNSLENIMFSHMNKKGLTNYSKELVTQNLDIFLFKIDMEKIEKISCFYGLELLDDISLPNSIINDFNENINDEDNSLILINDSLIKMIPLYGIFKKISSEKLEIIYLIRKNLNNNFDLINLIKSNLTKNLEILKIKNGLKINEEKTNENFKKYIDKFNDKNELYWVIVVQGQNSIYKSKKIIEFFVNSLILINEKNIKNEHEIKSFDFFLNKIQFSVYSSQNYQSSLNELRFLNQNNKNIVLNVNEEKNKVEKTKNSMILLSKSKNINNFLQNLFENNLKIIEIFIFKNNENEDIELLLENFKSKYELSILRKYWIISEPGTVCLSLIDISDIFSFNEIFGTVKFNENGEIIYSYKGKLGKNDKDNIVLSCENKDNGEKVKNYISITSYKHLI